MDNGDITIRVQSCKKDWFNFLQSNDCAYKDSNKVVAYYNDNVISGVILKSIR